MSFVVFLVLTEVKMLSEYPFTLVSRYFFRGVDNGGDTFSLWTNRLEGIIQTLRQSSVKNTSPDSVEQFTFSEREWLVLQTGMEELEYSKNQIILEQNKPFQGLFRIKSGIVRVEQQLPSETKLLTLLNEGQVFGEMSYFGKNTIAFIVAESEKLVVHKITESNLTTLLSTSSSLSLNFFRMICSLISRRLHNLPVLEAIAKINDDEVNYFWVLHLN